MTSGNGRSGPARPCCASAALTYPSRVNSADASKSGSIWQVRPSLEVNNQLPSAFRTALVTIVTRMGFLERLSDSFAKLTCPDRDWT